MRFPRICLGTLWQQEAAVAELQRQAGGIRRLL